MLADAALEFFLGTFFGVVLVALLILILSTQKPKT